MAQGQADVERKLFREQHYEGVEETKRFYGQGGAWLVDVILYNNTNIAVFRLTEDK